MRVGLLIYGSLDTVSGGYLYDRMLVKHLRDQGDQVEIISLPWRNYHRHLLDNISQRLWRQLKDLQVDILIQDELNHPSLVGLNRRLNPAYPIISLVHHLRCHELRPAWQNCFYRWVESRYLDRVDGFIINSKTTQQAVDRISRLGSRPWVVATPGGDRLVPQIEAGEIERRTQIPGPLRLVFVGNLIPRKGLHVLLAALARLPTDAAHLDIIGDMQVDPAYTHRIFRQVKESGLEAMISFLGILDDCSLAKVLRNAHVLVLPSSYEGFGIVYLEGMGFGLPVIGTNQGAAPEIIQEQVNGYLVDPEDARTLARVIHDLHRDRSQLVRLSLSARQRYHQFPNWEQSMAKVRSFLYEILEMHV